MDDHLLPSRNHKNELQWNGSAAQAWLKVDMENNGHINTKPEKLWELRDEYQEFYLSTFRDHLYQAKKTNKYLATLKLRDKENDRKQYKRQQKSGS